MESLPHSLPQREVTCPKCGAYVRTEFATDRPLSPFFNQCDPCRNRRRGTPAVVQRLPVLTPSRQVRLGVRAWAHEWITHQLSRSRRNQRPLVQFDAANVDEDCLAELWIRQNGLCALTGRTMIVPDRRRVGEGCNSLAPRYAHNVSVDRIDSKLPYAPGNLQLVCYAANVMKSNIPEDEFVAWCADVVKTKAS